MSNEAIFAIIMVIDLTLVLFVTKFGKEWLKVMIVANLFMTQLSAVKNVEIFGFVANGSAVFYASIFLATDIITEHWGRKEGHLSVWKGFLAVVFMVVTGNLLRMLVPIESTAVTQSFDILFGFVPRITIASLFAYIIAQNFDIWLYHFIRKKTNGKFLWLRNNGSTLLSQFLDSFLFFGIAFYGLVPSVWSLILTGYFAKLIVALFDTPFLYLSYKILNKPIQNSEKLS